MRLSHMAIMSAAAFSLIVQPLLAQADTTKPKAKAFKDLRVESIEPSSGGPGTQVTIQGTNFGTGSLDEIIVLAEGEGNFMFDIVSRSDNQIVAELVSVSPDAEPRRLIVAKGIGGSDDIPPQGEITFPDGVEGWCGDLSDPTKATLTNIVFHPDPDLSFMPGCGTPTTQQYTNWRLVGNEGCLDLPAEWCPNEEIYIVVVIRRNNVDRVMARTITIGSSTNTIVVGSAIMLAINTGMSLAGIPCFAIYNPSTNKVTVQCPNATITKVAGYLCRRFTNTSVETVQDETLDDFTTPTPTFLVPSSPFETWVINNCPSGTSEQFDEVDSNRCFAHAMTYTPGLIVAANLEIRVRAHGDVSTNDGLSLGFSGSSFEWGRSLSDLTGLGWNAGDTETICLDIARLPNSDGSTTNLLSSLANGDFEILVNDDSVVDYVTLRLRRCQ